MRITLRRRAAAKISRSFTQLTTHDVGQACCLVTRVALHKSGTFVAVVECALGQCGSGGAVAASGMSVGWVGVGALSAHDDDDDGGG